MVAELRPQLASHFETFGMRNVEALKLSRENVVYDWENALPIGLLIAGLARLLLMRHHEAESENRGFCPFEGVRCIWFALRLRGLGLGDRC